MADTDPRVNPEGEGADNPSEIPDPRSTPETPSPDESGADGGAEQSAPEDGSYPPQGESSDSGQEPAGPTPTRSEGWSGKGDEPADPPPLDENGPRDTDTPSEWRTAWDDELAQQRVALAKVRTEESDSAARRAELEEAVQWRARRSIEIENAVTLWKEQSTRVQKRLKDLEEICSTRRDELDPAVARRAQASIDRHKQDLGKAQQSVGKCERELAGAQEAADEADARVRELTATYTALTRQPSTVSQRASELERTGSRVSRGPVAGSETEHYATLEALEEHIESLRQEVPTDVQVFEQSLYDCCRELEEVRRQSGQRSDELAQVRARAIGERAVLEQCAGQLKSLTAS